MLVILTTFGLLLVKFVVSVNVAPVCTSPKANALGEKRTSTPVPDRATTCGLPGVEFVIVSVPVLGPTVVGEKLNNRLQVSPGGIVVQVLGVENSLLTEIAVIVSVMFPVFRRLTSLARLVVLTT